MGESKALDTFSRVIVFNKRRALATHIYFTLHYTEYPRRDSNPQSSASETDALSIRPRRRTHNERYAFEYRFERCSSFRMWREAAKR